MALRFLNSGYFAGSVGIGTVSPSGKFEIASDSSLSSYITQYTDDADGAELVIRTARGTQAVPVQYNTGDSAGRLLFQAYTSSGSFKDAASIESVMESGSANAYGGLRFNYMPTSSPYVLTEGMRLKANGNVGIGTNNPLTPLHVLDDSSANARAKIRIQGGATSGYGDLAVQSGYIRLIINDTDSTAYSASNQFNYINGSVATTLNSNGLGVGTTLPAFKLDVGGTFGVSNLPFNTDSVSVLVADETIGVEEVTNGSFTTDADWTKGTGWAIGGGTANGTSSVNPLYQTISGFTAGNVYKVRFEVTAVTSGYIRVYAYVGTNGTFTNIFNSTSLTTGVYESTFEFGGTNKILRFYGSVASTGGFTGSIDNVSVKQVTSASNQIQKRELGTGAFGPTPVGAYLPLTAGGSFPLTGALNINLGATSVSTIKLRRNTTGDSQIVGDIEFDTTAAEGTDDRIALIRAETQNGDGTTRGGQIKLYTRLSGSANFNTTTYDTFGNWGLPGILSVQGTGDSYFAGNVGIRTTSPGAFLQVGGTTNSNGSPGSFNIAGSYGVDSWARAYIASNTNILSILQADNTALPNGGAYRVTGHIDGTGTDQSSRAVFWNQNGTWQCNLTSASGTSSNSILFLIDATTGLPSVKTYHANDYTVRVWHERINLNEGVGTDNTRHYFGADAYMTQIGNDISMFTSYSGNNTVGNLGVGIAVPNAKLQVAGGIQMADDTDNAGAAKAGTMRYRTGTEYVEVTGAELISSTMINGNYSTFDGASSSGFHAINSANSDQRAGTVDEISFVANKTYRVNIDVDVTSGSAPFFRAREAIATSPVIKSAQLVNGSNIITFTSTITITGLLEFSNSSSNEYTLSNVSLMEVTAEDASYADMCMQTGASTYEWVNIVRNTY